MSKYKEVWSDEKGDLRKVSKVTSKVNSANDFNGSKNRGLLKNSVAIDTTSGVLTVRRLTSGKGRTVIEIANLPKHDSWCKELASDLKKSLGVGGTYKNGYIEIHGEKIDLVTQVLDEKNLKWKKIGG